MIQLDPSDSNAGAPRYIPQAPTPVKQRDQVGWSGLTISLLVHAIFILLAIFVLYKWVIPPTEKTVDFLPGGGGGGNGGEKANRVQTQMRQTMASANNRRISVSSEASFTLPESSDSPVDASLPSMDSILQSSGSGGGGGGGKGGGLGTGIGTGSGPGIGKGPAIGLSINPFGSKTLIQGSMPGYFYDFKQTRDGKPVSGYDTGRYEDYTTKLEDVQRSGYKESAFKKFFKAPDPLYLTQLAIPFSDAAGGPAFFGVADKVKPAGWLVHYGGSVTMDRDITFRFVGAADDYLGAYVNGHARLIATWPGVRALIAGRWEPKEPLDESAPTPVGACPVTYGEWIKMKRGESMNFDIGIGECPGGKVGFVLMVEEKDKEYRKAGNGAKILPVFTTETIKPETKARVQKDFPDWEFEWENVPVFPVTQKGPGDEI